MLPNQKDHPSRALVVEGKPLAHSLGNADAPSNVAAAVSLADVVKKEPQIERGDVFQPCEHLAQPRKLWVMRLHKLIEVSTALNVCSSIVYL